MAPTLVASYFVQTASPSTAALTTPSFTPSNGEVIVVKMETWDTSISMGSVTGGSQTYTSRVTIAPGGFRPWVGITTAVISGSPGSMTVSATPSASARYSMVVERWSGAQLAGTPAVGSADGGSGAANGSLTTTAANSVVSWTAGDSQSLNPSTRVYLNSATQDGLRDDHNGANGVGYHAYQTAASAGSQTFGLSAPTGMQWCIAGIEVKAAAGGSEVTGTAATSVTFTATAAGVRTAAGSAATAVTFTATVSGTRTAAGTAAASAGFTATAAGTVTVGGTAATSAGLTADATGTRTTFGTAATSVTFTATAVEGVQTIPGTAATSITLTATAAGTPTTPGTAATSVTFTATGAGTRTVLGAAALAVAFAAAAVTVATRGAGRGTVQSTHTGRHVQTTRR